MKAARFPGDGEIRIDEIPSPEPGPDDVLLQVSYCGLCGSDRKVLERGIQIIPGHEVSGVVVDGHGTGVADGTRAVVNLPLFCGECRYCQRGETNRCVNRAGLIGWTPPWSGGYAEYMRVPARNIVPISDDLPLDHAVLLLDNIGTAFHAVRMAQPRESERTLVIGCGALGLGVVAGLIAFGVNTVYASDYSEYRRAAAVDLGARAVTPEEAGSLPEIDVIIEVAGRPDTIVPAIDQVTPGGRVVMLGECWDPWTFSPTGNRMLKDYSLIRSWYFPLTEFEENQRMLLDGRAPAEKLISHVFDLDDLAAGFSLFLSGESRKVLARP